MTAAIQLLDLGFHDLFVPPSAGPRQRLPWINVTDPPFNAVDGTDISAALIAAIAAAHYRTTARTETPTIYIPAGHYYIDSDAVFSTVPDVANGLGSVRFLGDGMYSTLLQLRTGGATKWFFKNGTNNKAYQYASFHHMNFYSDSRTLGNGFEMWSAGFDHTIRFYDCIFENLNKVLSCIGSANADVNKFVTCQFRSINDAVLYLNNTQAIEHTFLGCDAEVIYGDVIRAERGGDVKWFGGSIILVANAGADHCILRVVESDGVGPSNGNFLFTGIKTELRGDGSKLANLGPGQQGFAKASFKDSNMNTLIDSTVARDLIRVGDGNELVFEDCILPQENTSGAGLVGDVTYTIESNASSHARSRSAHVVFIRCLVHHEFTDQWRSTAAGAGRFTARGCYGHGTDGVPTAIPRRAMDADWWAGAQGWVNGRTSNRIELKSAIFKNQTDAWPNTTGGAGSELTIILPANAYIKNIHILKPADAGGGAAYQLAVGNDDKTTTYASSVSATRGAEHRIDATNLMIATGTSMNTRTLRLWASTSAAFVGTTGFAIVEYY